jgi:pre-mRNA-splicing factor CWC22
VPGQAFDAAAEFAKLTAGSRTGGTYVPPARLREMQMEASKDKASPEYQRLVWDALRKSLNGLINKVRVFSERLIIRLRSVLSFVHGQLKTTPSSFLSRLSRLPSFLLDLTWNVDGYRST